MDLICFEVLPDRVELRPAPRRRQWMDETRNAMAYHCLPLVIANAHGWEMLCPFGFEARWNGGPAVSDLEITVDPEEARRRPELVLSNFGSGILSFNPQLVLRTAPGYNLWVTGPINRFKDGVQGLSASIETDWMPFTFSMNWKVTRPDATIRFEAGEPFAAFFPVQRGVVAACEPRLASIQEEPALEASYQWANARRRLDTVLAESERDSYQKWYSSGEMPRRSDGSAPADHETNVVARPFKR
jgi:hypothetical protein